MCLAIPAQVIKLLPQQQVIASVGGIEKIISTHLIDNIQVGDYILIHVGFALAKIDENEAKKTLSLLQEIAEVQHEIY